MEASRLSRLMVNTEKAASASSDQPGVKHKREALPSHTPHVLLFLSGPVASGHLPQKLPTADHAQVHGGLLHLLRSEGKTAGRQRQRAPAAELRGPVHQQQLRIYAERNSKVPVLVCCF